MLKATFSLNMIWASVIVFLILCMVQDGINLLIATSYFVLSICMLRRLRWAIALCVLVSVLSLTFWSWWVISTGIWYFKYEPDSPPTIFIMIGAILFFIIPALTLCALYAFSWRELKNMILKKQMLEKSFHRSFICI